MNIIQKGLTGAIFSILAGILSFLFQSVAAKYYGQDIYGEASYIISISTSISVFFSFGQQYYLSKFKHNSDEFSEIFWGIIIIFLVFSVIIFFVNTQIKFIENFSLIFTLALNIISLEIISSYLISLKKLQIVSFYKGFIFRILCNLLLLLFLPFYKTYWAIIVSMIISYTIVFIILISGRLKFIKPKFKKLLNPYYAIQIFNVLVNYIAIIFQKNYSDYSHVAILAISIAIASALNLVSQNLANSILPDIASYFNKNSVQKLKKLYYSVQRANAYIVIPASLFLIFFSREILYFFGEEYSKKYLILIFIIIGQLFNSLTGPNGSVLLMSRWYKIEIFNGIIRTTVAVIIILTMANNFYWAIAVAIALSEAITNLIKSIELYLFIKIIPIDYSALKYIFFLTIIDVFMFFLIHYFTDGITSIFLGLIIIATIPLRFRLSPNKDDKAILKLSK